MAGGGFGARVAVRDREIGREKEEDEEEQAYQCASELGAPAASQANRMLPHPAAASMAEMRNREIFLFFFFFRVC